MASSGHGDGGGGSVGAVAGSASAANAVASGDVGVLGECEGRLRSPDAIMDIRIADVMRRYLKAGGQPKNVILLLSEGYRGFAQMCQLVMEWLRMTGASDDDIRGIVDGYIRDITTKTFDKEKADSIFKSDSLSPPWLDAMVANKTWRALIYELWETHTDCLFINLAIKKIVDLGWESEITDVASAGTDAALYGRVLGDAIQRLLEAGEEDLKVELPRIVKLACQSEQAFLCAQAVLASLQRTHRNGRRVKRIFQCIGEGARQSGASDALVRNSSLLLMGASRHPHLMAAVGSILSTKSASPADVSMLFQCYDGATQAKPAPPAELVRLPGVFEALVESLFDPRKTVNANYKKRYFRVLAIASNVHDWDESLSASSLTSGGVGAPVSQHYGYGPTSQQRRLDSTEAQRRAEEHKKAVGELIDATETAITAAYDIVHGDPLRADWSSEIPNLFASLGHPVAAMGLLHWVSVTFEDAALLASALHETSNAPHFAVIDEAGRLHPRVRTACLSLIAALHDKERVIDVDLAPKYRIVLADRLVHLVWSGHVMPVLRWVAMASAGRKMDASALSYFVGEVLLLSDPPYSAPFASAILELMVAMSAASDVPTSGDVGQAFASFIDACMNDNMEQFVSRELADFLLRMHQRYSTITGIHRKMDES